MARVYFIGGAPRVGKSTLAEGFLATHPMAFAATDDLRANLRRTITPEAEPDLYYLDSLNADEANMARLMRNETAEIIAAADREAHIVWRAVESLVRQTTEIGQDILIEGVAALPQLVAQLDVPTTAVYLGNQSAGHTHIILNYAQRHPESWLGSLKPATIEAFAAFTRAYSAHAAEQARACGFPYIEMSTANFDISLTKALNTLH
jgi:2-phosphoglycerate kinase